MNQVETLLKLRPCLHQSESFVIFKAFGFGWNKYTDLVNISLCNYNVYANSPLPTFQREKPPLIFFPDFQPLVADADE